MEMPAFYDLSEGERIALTLETIRARRTLMERWSSLASPEGESWSARAALAARLLADARGVADLGCGTMTLERHLRPGVSYCPVDVVKRDHRTIVCDFNYGPPPSTGQPAVACLGLIEYLFDAEAFLSALSPFYRICVASYCAIDAKVPLEPRRSHGWVNDFTQSQLEQIFNRSGWMIQEVEIVDDGQIMWRLQSRHEHA